MALCGLPYGPKNGRQLSDGQLVKFGADDEWKSRRVRDQKFRELVASAQGADLATFRERSFAVLGASRSDPLDRVRNAIEGGDRGVETVVSRCLGVGVEQVDGE
jgi:hypothetical protein